MALQKHTKTKKNQQRSAQSTHSIFTQPVHFPPTDLRQPQLFLQICFVRINLGLLSLSASVNHRILIKKVEAKLGLVELSFVEHELLSIQWRAET